MLSNITFLMTFTASSALVQSRVLIVLMIVACNHCSAGETGPASRSKATWRTCGATPSAVQPTPDLIVDAK